MSASDFAPLREPGQPMTDTVRHRRPPHDHKCPGCDARIECGLICCENCNVIDCYPLIMRFGDVWEPAIPEPYYLLIRVRCHCGAKFWRRADYDAHWRSKHVSTPPTEQDDGN